MNEYFAMQNKKFCGKNSLSGRNQYLYPKSKKKYNYEGKIDQGKNMFKYYTVFKFCICVRNTYLFLFSIQFKLFLNYL